MTLESKKELLRYKILNDGFYQEIIYSILRHDYFNDVISKIDDVSISFDIDIQDNKIQSKQFLMLLDKFVEIVKKYFFNVGYTVYLIDDIIKPNITKMNEYLTLKCDIKENEDIVLEKIYKIIISNFINNAKYITSITTFLNEHRIKIKTVDEYTFDESKKIISLLSDLVFCQRGRGKLNYLFEDLESYINEHIEMGSYRKKQKHTPEYYQEREVAYFTTNYESIFKTYNNKRKYLKYFK